MNAERCVLVDGDEALVPILFDAVHEQEYALNAARDVVFGELFGFALWALVFILASAVF